jgi:hypothetical protein
MGYFAFEDFKLDASDIAHRINHFAELIMDGGDLVRYSQSIKYYWELAEVLGVKDKVEVLIQETSLKEMDEAIEAMGIKKP